jgi:hypothetical protein
LPRVFRTPPKWVAGDAPEDTTAPRAQGVMQDATATCFEAASVAAQATRVEAYPAAD